MNNTDEQGYKITTNLKSKNLPILLILGVYFVVAIVAVILFAPYAIKAFNYMIIDIYPETAITIFVIALFTSSVLLIMFISIYIRSKEKCNGNQCTEQMEISLHGIYDEERRYLEDKIDELTERLTNTEKKWKDVNHLIIAANEKTVNNQGKISAEKFLREFGIDIANIEIEKDLVFVLTPSDQEFVSDYLCVKSTCKEIKLRALRGDEQDLNYTNNNILAHILKYIVKSRIVIANISNRNPNVYYELGIAHMLGKPSILLCRRGMAVPFDLQQKYIVFYADNEELSSKLNDALLNIITVQ